MKTSMPRLPRIAYSAELPVSPEVAPRMFSVLPLFASVYSNRLPRSCSAMSLNASVGPFDACSRWTPGSSVVTGVIASLPKVAFVYVRSISALRSAAGMSVM